MKTFLHTIALIVILGIVGVVLGYVMQSKETPKSQGSPTTATSTPDIGLECGSPIAITTEIIYEEASSSPSVSAEYPQFPSLSLQFNRSIESAVLTRLDEFRKEVAGNKISRPNDLSFLARYESIQANESYVSLVIRFDSYVGGANENQDLETFNYDVVNKNVIALRDLFASSTDYLTLISSEARKQLANNLGAAAADATPAEMLLKGTESREENFRNFTFNKSFIQIYFPKYSVAAGSFGEQKVEISSNNACR